MFSTMFTQPQQMFAHWQSMMTGQSDRLEELTLQMEEMEQTAMKRANEAIDEYAQLMKASLEYQRKLMTAWRSQMIEASKSAAESMQPQAVATPDTEA